MLLERERPPEDKFVVGLQGDQINVIEASLLPSWMILAYRSLSIPCPNLTEFSPSSLIIGKENGGFPRICDSRSFMAFAKNFWLHVRFKVEISQRSYGYNELCPLIQRCRALYRSASEGDSLVAHVIRIYHGLACSGRSGRRTDPPLALIGRFHCEAFPCLGRCFEDRITKPIFHSLEVPKRRPEG